jgi:hypothetical protein
VSPLVSVSRFASMLLSLLLLDVLALASIVTRGVHGCVQCGIAVLLQQTGCRCDKAATRRSICDALKQRGPDASDTVVIDSPAGLVSNAYRAAEHRVQCAGGTSAIDAADVP